MHQADVDYDRAPSDPRIYVLHVLLHEVEHVLVDQGALHKQETRPDHAEAEVEKPEAHVRVEVVEVQREGQGEKEQEGGQVLQGACHVGAEGRGQGGQRGDPEEGVLEDAEGHEEDEQRVQDGQGFIEDVACREVYKACVLYVRNERLLSLANFVFYELVVAILKRETYVREDDHANVYHIQPIHPI